MEVGRVKVILGVRFGAHRLPDERSWRVFVATFDLIRVVGIALYTYSYCLSSLVRGRHRGFRFLRSSPVTPHLRDTTRDFGDITGVKETG